MILDETYEYLNMSYRPHVPAAEVIWGHDNELLQKALRFYEYPEREVQAPEG